MFYANALKHVLKLVELEVQLINFMYRIKMNGHYQISPLVLLMLNTKSTPVLNFNGDRLEVE